MCWPSMYSITKVRARRRQWRRRRTGARCWGDSDRQNLPFAAEAVKIETSLLGRGGVILRRRAAEIRNRSSASKTVPMPPSPIWRMRRKTSNKRACQRMPLSFRQYACVAEASAGFQKFRIRALAVVMRGQ